MKQLLVPSQEPNIADWYELLAIYTRRNLTNDRDGLPALSGIANEFQRTRDTGRYLAGLWETDLLRGLLWRAEKPGSRTLGDGTHLSSPPSWSWTSIRGSGIKWSKGSARDTESLAEVAYASCTLTTADDKGLVSGGQLTLRGKLIPLTVQRYTEGISDYEMESEYDGMESYKIIPPRDICRLLSKYSEAPAWIAPLKFCDYQHEWGEFDPDVLFGPESENVVLRGPLYFLPLRLSKTTQWRDVFHPEGIFLRELPRCPKRADERNADVTSSPMFERVGCGSIGAYSAAEFSCASFLEEFQDTTVMIV